MKDQTKPRCSALPPHGSAKKVCDTRGHQEGVPHKTEGSSLESTLHRGHAATAFSSSERLRFPGASMGPGCARFTSSSRSQAGVEHGTAKLRHRTV